MADSQRLVTTPRKILAEFDSWLDDLVEGRKQDPDPPHTYGLPVAGKLYAVVLCQQGSQTTVVMELQLIGELDDERQVKRPVPGQAPIIGLEMPKDLEIVTVKMTF